MSNFIIEEFSFYKIFLYGKGAAGEQTDYGIDIKLSNARVYLRFCNNHMPKNYVEETGKRQKIHVYLRADKYPAWIDILRYEKPLFFFYDYDNDLCYLTTSDEPVGEEESSDD